MRRSRREKKSKAERQTAKIRTECFTTPRHLPNWGLFFNVSIKGSAKSAK